MASFCKNQSCYYASSKVERFFSIGESVPLWVEWSRNEEAEQSKRSEATTFARSANARATPGWTASEEIIEWHCPLRSNSHGEKIATKPQWFQLQPQAPLSAFSSYLFFGSNPHPPRRLAWRTQGLRFPCRSTHDSGLGLFFFFFFFFF